LTRRFRMPSPSDDHHEHQPHSATSRTGVACSRPWTGGIVLLGSGLLWQPTAFSADEAVRIPAPSTLPATGPIPAACHLCRRLLLGSTGRIPACQRRATRRLGL
jgi:hypothetical protein